jgi:trans-aconitate methyltransferase
MYADLVKWGMPEIEGLRHYRLPNAQASDKGDWILAVSTETADVEAVIPDKAAEAIITQHALEWLADARETQKAGRAIDKLEDVSWLTLSMEPSHVEGWQLEQTNFTGGERHLGSGSTLLAAIWEAAKGGE